MQFNAMNDITDSPPLPTYQEVEEHYYANYSSWMASSLASAAGKKCSVLQQIINTHYCITNIVYFS